MNERVTELERRLGFQLPDLYRQFLQTHTDSLLEASLIFDAPRSGVIDELLTVEQILKNEESERIGIPEQSLLHIGGNLMGGYLYLKVSEKSFGEVHYSEQYVLREYFRSFEAFLNETSPEMA